MRRFSVAFLVLAFAAAPVALAAGSGGTKVGLLNLQRVMTKSTAGREVIQQIRGFGKQLQAKMNSRQDELKKEGQDLQKNAKIETAAQQKKAQKTFQAHLQSFQQAAKKARKSFAEKRNSLMVPLQAKLNDVVTAYAKKHGYNLILDSQTAVYNVPSLNITAAILKAFNKAQPHPPKHDNAVRAGGNGQ
jgi:outer membrane protein